MTRSPDVVGVIICLVIYGAVWLGGGLALGWWLL